MTDIFLYEVPAFTNEADIKLLITTEAQQSTSTAAVAWIGKRETPEEAERIWLQSHGKYVEPEVIAPLKRAERRVAARADRVRSKPLKQALQEAADAIAEATERAQNAFTQAETLRLTNIMNAAVNTSNTKQAIAQAHLATQIAHAMMARAEQDDEEQIITMLLTHDR